MTLWEYLVAEMIVQLVIASTILMVIAVIINRFGIKYEYMPKLADVLYYSSNFIAICSTLVMFSIAVACFLEALVTQMVIFGVLSLGFFIITIKINKSRS
ncbi:MAG: hypothetical protein WC874_01690 [Candidatus Izemoplasmatales bacterium]|jgi:hypothetical protein|nr:hypothetical protein [Candidatus Izemoplasmatales bacterium]MDD3865190.1 hypothetical protein [Candidatus Izemoplasmatales bacterium]